MYLKQINVTNKFILEVKFIKEDGSNHRKCYAPNCDINSIEYDEVKQKALELWTPAVIQDYKDSLNNDLEVLDGTQS